MYTSRHFALTLALVATSLASVLLINHALQAAPAEAAITQYSTKWKATKQIAIEVSKVENWNQINTSNLNWTDIQTRTVARVRVGVAEWKVTGQVPTTGVNFKEIWSIPGGEQMQAMVTFQAPNASHVPNGCRILTDNNGANSGRMWCANVQPGGYLFNLGTAIPQYLLNAGADALETKVFPTSSNADYVSPGGAANGTTYGQFRATGSYGTSMGAFFQPLEWTINGYVCDGAEANSSTCR